MRNRTLASLVTIGGLAALIGGCGGSSKTTTVTVAAPDATPTTTVTTPTTTVATPTTPDTTPTISTPSADSKRQDPITVKGKTGDPLTLLGQYATSISGAVKPRVKVQVTLTKVVGPFGGYDLAKGHKLIGFELHVKNIGAKKFSDALPSGTLILVGGENGKQTNLITGSGKSPCDNPSLKLAQGEAKDVCVAFDVPKSAKLETFQFETDSGYGDTGLWRLT
jgi:hypothetical protein